MVKSFRDYEDEEILLSENVWKEHIQKLHPEITEEIITETLRGPNIVCESQHQNMQGYRLYYKGPWKNKRGKDRYHRVVVKICSDGNWISTVHTRGSVSCGVILYKEGER